MDRQTKIDTVSELQDTLAKAQSLVLADYRGSTVEEINGLRSEMRKANCTYRVIKNTLVRRAITGTPMEPLTEMLAGPTAIAYSFDDPVSPAKVIDKFLDDLKHFDIKGGFLDGEVLDEAGVKQLATMKGKDELRSDLLRLFQAPAQNFVAFTQAAPQNFMYLLTARERALSEG